MNLDKARDICRSVEGEETTDGLATVCIALIHLAATHGYSKDEALQAMAGQWDLYEKRSKDKLN